MKRRGIFIVLFFLCTIRVFAQPNVDTISYPYIKVVENYFFSISEVDSIMQDTTLKFFGNNIPTDSSISFQYSGVPGLAFKNLNLKTDSKILREFSYNKDLDYFKKNKKLLLTKNRFSHIKYGLGSGKEQSLDLLHSQNIVRGLNASLNYRRVSSEGILRRQFTKQSSFEFFPWYQSINGIYAIYLNVNIKNIDIQENGGISADTLPATSDDLSLIPINLLNARNESKSSNGELIQKFNFVKLNLSDTSKFIHSIIHRIHFSSEKSTYVDTNPESDFYNTLFYDSSITDDILRKKRMTNYLQYGLRLNLESTAALYFENDIMVIKQRSLDSTLNSYYSGLKLNQRFSFINLSLNGVYTFSGSNINDFLIHSNVLFNLTDCNLSLEYIRKEANPDLIYSIFQSNHFAWYNFTEKVRTSYYAIHINSPKINTEVNLKYAVNKNYTYFNEWSLPEQFDEKLKRLAVELKNIFEIGKFGIETNTLYQKVSNESIINLPEISFRGNLFYQNYLSNNALLARTGVEVFYMTSFMGENYMPPLRQFYLQNEIMVAGYPQLNLFVNLKIKTARVFLRVDNLNHGLNEEYNYTTPSYPMPGRVFRFGINWIFFD